MTFENSLQPLFFGVDQTPVEAVLSQNGASRRLAVPGKKALVHSDTGHVLGVVSRGYRVVTNREAVDLAREVCGRAFPGLLPVEWETKRAASPRTMSYAFIDLVHRTHVLNYFGSGPEAADPYTPFLRVTNSFNGARALRFDVGFMRLHCSNGVIFEKEVATIKASHCKESLEKLKIEITSRSLPQMWDEFSKFLTSIRSVLMTPEQSTLALHTVLHFPEAKREDNPTRREALNALSVDFSARLGGYRNELGPNAYAVFNTLTDIAARPPDSAYFQKDRQTIETRAGRWLKELAKKSAALYFDLNEWIPSWEADTRRRAIPGRN